MADDPEEETIDEKYDFIEDTDEREEPDDEKGAMMNEGELEENVYSDVGREKLVEDDEMEQWEEGFSMGAEDGGRGAKCRYCGKILINKEDAHERRIEGELCFFCSEEHVGKYIEKKEKEKQKG